MSRGLAFWPALALLLAAPFVGYALAYVGGALGPNADGALPPPPALIEKAVIAEPVPVGSFELTDDRGARFDASAFEGKWSFVLFGYTQCPDVCPLTLNHLGDIREAMAASMPASELPQFVFISVDPARDRPEDLNGYVTYFNPAFRAATGSVAEIDRFVDRIGAFYRHERKRSDGEYEVTHSAEIFVFDPEARHFATLHPPLDAKNIVDRFRALAAHFAATGAARS